jgi:AcrR family transcriptional regulator
LNPAKRDRILDGMLETVGTDGYESTSVRSLLARTGLYRQAFYDHFSSKEECFLAAYDAGLARVEALLRSAAAGEGAWRGQLRAGLGALLDLLDTEPALGRALLVEVHPAGEAALAKRNAALVRAQSFLEGGRAEAAALPDTPTAPRIAPEAVAAGIQVVLHSRLASGKPGELKRLLPEFVFVAVLPYFGTEMAQAEMRAAKP